MNQNEINEELIGEILELQCSVCNARSYRDGACLNPAMKETLCIPETKRAITRIGQAYADGMPLPGEVGRTWVRAKTEDAIVLNTWNVFRALHENDNIIALRQKEGGYR